MSEHCLPNENDQSGRQVEVGGGQAQEGDIGTVLQGKSLASAGCLAWFNVTSSVTVGDVRQAQVGDKDEGLDIKIPARGAGESGLQLSRKRRQKSASSGQPAAWISAKGIAAIIGAEDDEASRVEHCDASECRGEGERRHILQKRKWGQREQRQKHDVRRTQVESIRQLGQFE